MTALDVFTDYLTSLAADWRGSSAAKDRVMSVWKANDCPLIVSCPDPRHDGEHDVLFVFQLTESGPTFTLHYTLALAANLECPPTIAAIGAATPAVTPELAPTAETPSTPEEVTEAARRPPSATLTAT